jgi:hypothetical protein
VATQARLHLPAKLAIAPTKATTASKSPVGVPIETISLLAHRGQPFCGLITASDIT